MQISNKLSPSALTSLATCRQQWYWSRKYTRIKRAEYFALGTGIHDALERYYRGMRNGVKVNLVKVFTDWAMLEMDSCQDSEDRATLNKVRVKGIGMLEAYTYRYPRDKEPFEVIEIEHTMSRTIPGTDWITESRIDGIIRHKRTGKYWGIEHKTFGTFHEFYLYLAHQFVIEAWAGDHWAKQNLGIHLEGVLYNGLHSVLPGYKGAGAPFERVWLSPTRTQIKTVIRRLQDTVEMLERGSIAIYPEPDEIRCNMCQFKDPCSAKQREENYQYMLKHLYTEYVR